MIETMTGDKQVIDPKTADNLSKNLFVKKRIKFCKRFLTLSKMIWARMSWNGRMILKRIDGITDAKMYHGILLVYFAMGAFRRGAEGFYFQEDNDPKYSAKIDRAI